MNIENNKILVRSLFEAFNSNDVNALIDKIDEYFAPEYTLHRPFEPDMVGGENLEKLLRNEFNFVPDWHLTIEDLFGEEDKLVCRFFSSNSIIPFSSVSVFRFSNGRIAEEWELVVTQPGQK